MPARAPASMLMLQMVMRASMESARMASPAYSITWPVAPSVPIFAMMRGSCPLPSRPRPGTPREFHQQRLGLRLRQALRGHHVLHFGGADAESQSAKSSVRAGMGVTADDRHARLGHAQFRPDHVNNSLLGRIHIKKSNTKVRAVFAQRLHLRAGQRICPAACGCRWWERCGRPWRWSGQGGAASAWLAAVRRTPAAR